MVVRGGAEVDFSGVYLNSKVNIQKKIFPFEERTKLKNAEPRLLGEVTFADGEGNIKNKTSRKVS